MKKLSLIKLSIFLIFIFTSYPFKSEGNVFNYVDFPINIRLGWNQFTDLSLGINKFCFTDQESEVKTELVLIDGGDAEITFYNSNNVATRRGQATWRGSSDGPGGDMAKIYLRLSTGVTLTFRAVVDQYTSNITMLIDSKDNIWALCY